jgi:hypothetical protein
MLNQFIDEVVSEGAAAVLPQNLDTKWLDMIYVAARNFLKISLTCEGNIPEEDVLSDMNSMMLLSAVVEIAQHQSGYGPDITPVEIPEDLIFEYISCYALAIVLECIVRESGIEMVPPELDSIFDRERLFEIEQNNHELTDLLNKLIIEM